MVVLNGKILTAPVIRDAIGGGKIVLDGRQVTFWRQVPWMQAMIENSYKDSRHSIMVYVLVVLAASIAALAFVLLPRLKRPRAPDPE